MEILAWFYSWKFASVHPFVACNSKWFLKFVSSILETKDTYLQLIARHLANVATLTYSHMVVLLLAFLDALDEAHKMLINKDVKSAIRRLNQQQISRLTTYLSHRARALKNLKTQVPFSDSQSAFATTILKSEQSNIRELSSAVAAENTSLGNQNAWLQVSSSPSS